MCYLNIYGYWNIFLDRDRGVYRCFGLIMNVGGEIVMYLVLIVWGVSYRDSLILCFLFICLWYDLPFDINIW